MISALILSVALLGIGEYQEGIAKARKEKKMLIVNFGQQFLSAQPGFVSITIPVDYTYTDSTGKRVQLIKDESMAGLEGDEGLVVIDCKNPDQMFQVITALPKRHCSKPKAVVVYQLPEQSLTQRTLVWAFMIHPQRPQSVYGMPDSKMFKFCEKHSQLQAASNRQFHSSGWIEIGKSEIVAESWTWNKALCDAAIDCVWSWSQSPGHWRAASSRWGSYGFDIKWSGEKWYATGLFR